MSDFLLDTTVFIDYYRGDPNARDIFEEVLAGRQEGSFSPMSVLELWMGNTSDREEQFYRDILVVLEEAPLNHIIAERAAGLLRSLGGDFRETLVRDALIAATAGERGEPIYTRNARDFQRFGVEVRAY